MPNMPSLQNLWRSICRDTVYGTSRTNRQPKQLLSFPTLQILESRLNPATVTWIKLAGGDWATGSNWDVGHAPLSGDDVVINALNSGAKVTHLSGNESIASLTLRANFNLAGGSLSINGTSSLSTTLTVQSGATLSVNNATVTAVETSYTGFGIVVNGLMNVTNSTFIKTGTYGSSSFVVNAGGQLKSTGSNYAWSGGSFENGCVMNANDITGNNFYQTIVIPAIDATLLANNKNFRDIEIQSGSLTNGQTATFSPMGTEAQNLQRFVFTAATGNFTIQSAATLNITAGAVVVAKESSYTSFGIVVNGTLNVSGATLSHTNTYGSSAILVNAGGRLKSTNSTYSWSGLAFANGSSLSTGDIVSSAFDQTITIPASFSTLLADNKRFQDVEIQPGNVTNGQVVTLSPLGTESFANQRFVFNAATGNFTIQSGGTLNVTAGTQLIAKETSYTTFGIIVNGAMNVTSASFLHTSTYGSSTLQVGAGGRLRATNTAFTWSGFSLANGSLLSAGDISANTFDQTITIPVASAVLLADNRRFQDIELQPGSIASGQTVTLAPLGTDTTANQRYIFNAATGNLNIQSGGTLTVANGSRLIAQETSYTTFGIIVSGTMNVTGVIFNHTSTYGSATIQVKAGGRLKATGSTFAWSALSLANGSLLSATDITTNGFDQTITIPAAYSALVANNRRFQDVEIQPGSIASGQTVNLAPIGTDTIANQRYIFNAATGLFTVQSGGTLNIADGSRLIAQETSYTAFGIAVSGNLNVINSRFIHTSTYGSSAIQIKAGGRMKASGSTFAWSGLSMATSSLLSTGDISGNGFDQTITIPAAYSSLLADNRRFQDVEIQPGSIAGGQTVTLAPIGTDTTANQRYIFNATTGNLNVQAGGVLNIDAGSLLVAQETSYTTFGIVVNGLLKINNARFTHTSTYGSSTIQVNSGGRLKATDTTFIWSAINLKNGSLLDAGDITRNGFDQTISIPAIDAVLFADNLRFQDIVIQPGSLTSGQQATLAPMGTDSTVTQRYIFDASTGNFNVQAGSTLNVTSGAVLVAAESSSTVFGITVSGIMNVAGASLSHTSTYASSTLQIQSGGHLTMTGSSFGWANLNLNAGSIDDIQFDSFVATITMNSGASINVNANDFGGVAANGLLALGTASATIDLRKNYWGTTIASEIAAKIKDHVDDATRPTVWYSPFLGEIPTRYFDPASLPVARAGADYSQTISSAGSYGPASSYSISAGRLPYGLSLTSDGLLAGTPTEVGSFTFTISANDNSPSSGAFVADQIYWLNVTPPVLTFTPTSLSPASSNAFFSQQITPTGGTAPYSHFTVSGGTLPAGLTLSSDGLLSGSPTDPDGIYSFTISAQDSSTGATAPYSGSQDFSLLVDGTLPSAGTVNDGSGADIVFQASANSISANWSGFSDSGSGIVSYLWSIGTTPGGTDVQAMTDVGNTISASATGLSLSDGVTYYVSVVAKDLAGNTSFSASSNGVIIDKTAPASGSVNDGSGADIDSQLSTNSISANWTGFSDSGSGISAYQWAIGTTPGGANVQAFKEVGLSSNAVVNNLSLVNGTTYYVSIRAVDAVGNIGLPASSNGVQVVTPAPVFTGYTDDGGVIGDGLTNDVSPILSGTGEAGATIQVFDNLTLLGQTTAGNDGKWQFTTPTLADGPHTFRASATHSGGGSTSVLSDPLTLTIDSVAPAVTINQDNGQIDPANTSPITFIVRFSKPVTGFSNADVDLTGTTVSGTPNVQVTGSGTDYTVTVSGISGTGVVVASIPAGAAVDVAGNGSLASTSDDHTVAFDNISPSISINPVAGQADPALTGPVKFAVHFSEPVTGFTDADVDLSGSTVSGTLSATVTGSGADYEISVTGMFGFGNVVASIPAGVASDVTGNLNLAYSGATNRVRFNHVGSLNFANPTANTTEGSTITVMVSRTDGGDGATTVHYSTVDGTAKAGADFTETSGTLSWADGDNDPKAISIPITNDAINEGRETFGIALDSPTTGGVLGSNSSMLVTIAPSDGVTINGLDKLPQATITDIDGDLITIKLAGKVGSLTFYDTNGFGPISEIDLSGTDPSKSIVTITVTKPRGGIGDGRVVVGDILGTGVKMLSLAAVDLDGALGNGVNLTSYLGSMVVGAIRNGADVSLAGTPPRTGLGSTITAGVIGDGTNIAITGAPLTTLTATAIGIGSISAPSIGTISVTGKAKTRTTVAIPGDIKSNILVAGTGLAPKVAALKILRVAGAVSGSSIQIGGGVGTVGDVGTVSVGSFVNSVLSAGYTGPNDGTGTFNLPSTITSFTVTGTSSAFSHSNVLGSIIKTVSLASVDLSNPSQKHGFVYHNTLTSLYVKSTKFRFNPKGSATQGMPSSGFEIKKV